MSNFIDDSESSVLIHKFHTTKSVKNSEFCSAQIKYQFNFVDLRKTILSCYCSINYLYFWKVDPIFLAYYDNRDKPSVRVIAATKTKKSNKVSFFYSIK
jgi:hypothetical protein